MTIRAQPATYAPHDVAVVIAAYNASATIGRAIRSALAEPEVREVIVVDDKSADDTVDRARAHDDGTGRLSVIAVDENGGPAAARNRGIEASHAPIVALLDSDDYYLPGRFARLFAQKDWDFVADNIAILREDAPLAVSPSAESAPDIAPLRLSATAFVESCLSQRHRYRGELAFLKPAMRRAFLDAHGLHYAAQLRLAEDFDFYTRALMAGARFVVAPSCHYVAVERATSLSATHNVADLERFVALDRALLAQASDGALQAALKRHLAQTRAKFRHRAFLANKSEHGLVSALTTEIVHPADLVGVLAKIASDKLSIARFFPPPAPPRPLRYLIEA